MGENTKSINNNVLLFNAADNSYNDIQFEFHQRIESACKKNLDDKARLANDINQVWNVYAAELSGVLRLVGREWNVGVLSGWSHHQLVQKYNDLIVELNDLCEKSLADACIVSNANTKSTDC